MIIYFMPIPIVTSIIGVSLTLAFHNNYAEYQTIKSLYKMEHSYATHEFIFYKEKSINNVISQYNSIGVEEKKQFIINSLKLSSYPESDKINVPYFKEISWENIKEYIFSIRNNQSLSSWNTFKKNNIENYLYFKWTAFTTADYLEKITTLNFVKASNTGFVFGTIILSISILAVISMMTYYYFSKKNGYEKDMRDLGYDVRIEKNVEEKIEFRKEDKMSSREKMETIDMLSKNKEVIDFQNRNTSIGFKNKVLQPKSKQENSFTSRINPYKPIVRNDYSTKKIDLENTKKINLFQKQLEKSKKNKKISIFKKNKETKKVDKILRNK